MKLSTGKVAFPIEFDNGDVQNIYFNPTDPELATRLMAAKDKISARMQELNFSDFEMSNDGEAVVNDISDYENLTDEQIVAVTQKAEAIKNVMAEIKQIIIDELNTAFGSDVSTVIFKYCSPFAIVNGNYYILNFLEAIAPEIKKYIEKSNKEAEKKMQKHIGKYQKKK